MTLSRLNFTWFANLHFTSLEFNCIYTLPRPFFSEFLPSGIKTGLLLLYLLCNDNTWHRYNAIWNNFFYYKGFELVQNLTSLGKKNSKCVGLVQILTQFYRFSNFKVPDFTKCIATTHLDNKLNRLQIQYAIYKWEKLLKTEHIEKKIKIPS